MAGCVQHSDVSVADPQDIAVVKCLIGKGDLGPLSEVEGSSSTLRKFGCAGVVVGVDVGVDDMSNWGSRARGELDVGLGISLRVHDDSCSQAHTPDHVRGAEVVVMQELPEVHIWVPFSLRPSIPSPRAIVKCSVEYYIVGVKTLRRTQADSGVRLGIRANLGQFMLLIAVNGLVGAFVGQERTLVPLFGERIFALRSTTAVLLFIVTFGIAKAASNLAAGALADRVGRKRILMAGWVVGLPVPLILMIAPSWSWVVAANILLGINQGLTWSITVMMKIDLAGPRRRGLAMGLNEFSGYLAVGLSAAASGALAARYGLRPEPLFLGLAIAALGLGVSSIFVKETSVHAELENDGAPPKSFREVVRLTSFGDPRLAAISRTGLVNNANDAHA